jgi:hypothetical protein
VAAITLPTHAPSLKASSDRMTRPYAVRLSGRSDERTDNRTGHDELHVRTKATRSVPTEEPVKQLGSTGTQKGDNVLQIGGGARCRAESRGVERAAPAGQENEAKEAARDLEAARVDVLVRKTIARKVHDRPEDDGRQARSSCGPGGGAGRDVERDDHGRRF